MQTKYPSSVTLNSYKKEKIKLLHECGFQNVTIETFEKAKTEISVDNIFLDIIHNNKRTNPIKPKRKCMVRL